MNDLLTDLHLLAQRWITRNGSCGFSTSFTIGFLWLTAVQRFNALYFIFQLVYYKMFSWTKIDLF